MSDSEYLTAAEGQGMAPASEEALTQLAPQQYASMIVVVEKAKGGVHITYRDGRSAQPLATLDVAAGKHLSDGDASQVAQGAQQTLAQLQGGAVGAPPPSAAGGGTPVAGPAPGTEAPSSEASEPVTGPPADAAPEGTEDEQSLFAEISAGMGVATRGVSLPTSGGDRKLATGAFPAVDLGLQGYAPIGKHFRFGGGIRYQTSLGLTAHEQPPGGTEKATTARSHHVELGVMPAYRFTDSKESVVVALFAGWAVRGFRPVTPLSLPAYTLHGPVLRPELRLAFAEGHVTLRLGPELIGLISVSHELRNLGNTSGAGIGIGGEGQLTVELVQGLSMALSYRESHLSVSTAWPELFQDVERFATLQAVLQY
jgi:hypothetical protein